MATQKSPKIETVDQTEAPEANPTPKEQFDSFGASRQTKSTNQFDDMERLRARQDFVGQTGVKKILVTVPVRKPHRQEFIRVRPEPEFCFDFPCIELKDDNEVYIVDPGMVSDLAAEVSYRTFYTAITRQGVLFLWPAKTPSPDGGAGVEWHLSAIQGAELAMKQWVRIASNKPLGAYEIVIATDKLPEPEWPPYSFKEICEVAFRNRPIIRSFDHDVVKRLRGQV
jgi:hypothetical protein